MTKRKLHIVIAGAGIGGLTTALCALHFGHSVTVIERAPKLLGIGAGIQLSPNAMRVMDKIGLTERLKQGGFTPEGIELRMGRSGRTLFHAPLGETAQRLWGAPYLHIHRADLIDALTQALRRKALDALRLGTTVREYGQSTDKARVILDDGAYVEGDVIICADGLNSALAAQMNGTSAPRYTGHMAWRAVIDTQRLGASTPRPVASAWMGSRRHAVTYLLRGGQLANFVGVVERDEAGVEDWAKQADKAEAIADFAGWHSEVKGLIEAADTLYQWPLYDRPALTSWTDGRVALLGDSAHPMLPFMAQGAAMAIEDSWCVMAQLSKDIPIDKALERYQTLRLSRASKLQDVSRKNGKIFHQSTVAGKLLTYGPMWAAGRIAPALINRRQNWIYGFDVTKNSPSQV